jgi:hypothetical protein
MAVPNICRNMLLSTIGIIRGMANVSECLSKLAPDSSTRIQLEDATAHLTSASKNLLRASESWRRE